MKCNPEISINIFDKDESLVNHTGLGLQHQEIIKDMVMMI